MPSTSTRHMRQAPTGGAEPRLVAEDGDLDPGASAVSTRPVPSATWTSRSSTTTRDELGALTRAPRRLAVCACWSTGARTLVERRVAAERAAAVVDVRGGTRRGTCRRSSRPASPPRRRAGRGTCRGCGRRRRAAGRGRRARACPSSILLEDLHHPARPLAARRALAARLVHVELRDPQAELHHAAAVVDHDHRAGAEERLRLRPSSRSRAASRSRRRVSTGTDEPPGMIAFSLRPSGMPPPMS